MSDLSLVRTVNALHQQSNRTKRNVLTHYDGLVKSKLILKMMMDTGSGLVNQPSQ